MGGNYRIAGGPSINMNTSTTGVPPSLVASAGSHQFQVPFAIHANTTANIASGATLTFQQLTRSEGQLVHQDG